MSALDDLITQARDTGGESQSIEAGCELLQLRVDVEQANWFRAQIDKTDLGNTLEQLRFAKKRLGEYGEAHQDLLDFDVEGYIQSLPWTEAATDDEKTLVAGNLRRLYFKLTHTDETFISE